jgi:NADPH:quinone reductase-like Zn-dependent oxidoreductase
MISLSLEGKIKKSSITQFTAQANREDLETLALLIQQGKIKVHLEKTFDYKQIPEAIGYIEAMRTRGKVAMVWESID